MPHGALTHAEPSTEEPPSEWEPVLLRSVRERARHAAPSTEPVRAETVPETVPVPVPVPQRGEPGGARKGSHAARELVEDRRRHAAAVATAPPAVSPAPEPTPAAPAKVSKHDQVATQMPGVYRFTPRRNARRLLNLALLAGLAVTAYLGWEAYRLRDTESVGLAAVAAVAAGAVWAIRSGAAVTRLTVRQGQLEVLQQGERLVFDLASPYTLVEVHGRPGRRGWKVVLPRRHLEPFQVDASIVDPDDFMRVLRFFRPDLVHH